MIGNNRINEIYKNIVLLFFRYFENIEYSGKTRELDKIALKSNIVLNANRFLKNKNIGDIKIEYSGRGFPTGKVLSFEQVANSKFSMKNLDLRKKQFSSGYKIIPLIKKIVIILTSKIMAKNISNFFFIFVKINFLRVILESMCS